MPHPGGRPTEYTPKLLKKAKKYLEEAEKNEKSYPSIAGMALDLNLSRETVHTWRKEDDKKEFSDIVERVLALQEYRLSSKGLEGTYNPTITKLLLTKHGYTDKQDLTTDGKELPTPILNAVFSNNSNEKDSQAE